MKRECPYLFRAACLWGFLLQAPVQSVLRDTLQQVQAKGRNELTIVVLGAEHFSPPPLLPRLVIMASLLQWPPLWHCRACVWVWARIFSF